jgi:hypothetical protein
MEETYGHTNIIYNSQKAEATQVSTNTMEYYPAFEKKEILTHSTTWMNPENIMLSEIS